MHVEDLPASLHVGQVDRHAPIEPSGAQKLDEGRLGEMRLQRMPYPNAKLGSGHTNGWSWTPLSMTVAVVHAENIPELPGEGCPGCTIAICCDGGPFHSQSKPPTCDCNGAPYSPPDSRKEL